MDAKLAHCAAAALVGAAVALMAPAVVAEGEQLVAEVVQGHEAPVKVADGGEARIVPMARGRVGHLGELRLEAGAELDPEPRDEEHYLYGLRGSAVINVDGHRYLVGPRTGVYVPAGADVRWANGADEFVAIQVLAGSSPVEGFDDWNAEDEEAWPRPRNWPTPDPAEISVR